MLSCMYMTSALVAHLLHFDMRLIVTSFLFLLAISIYAGGMCDKHPNVGLGMHTWCVYRAVWQAAIRHCVQCKSLCAGHTLA